MLNKPVAITKVLSMNDSGETGGHQAGILVPKGSEALAFFPDLGCEEKNPRVVLHYVDESGVDWKFNFIYYNNKFFDAKGTRNEYRLTGMTGYIRDHGLKAGDSIILRHGENDIDEIHCQRASVLNIKTVETADGKEKKRLTINSAWKVIDY